MLAVSPAAQRGGVGRRLVQECIDRATAAGKARIVLHTTEAMLAAQSLYGSFGFDRTPRRDFMATPSMRLIAYVLELSTGSVRSRSSPSGRAAISRPVCTSNTARGVPAAHQTVSKRRSDESTSVRSGWSCPSGGTPPMANPVASLTSSAVARRSAESGGIHAPVAGAEHEHRARVVVEHERLHDLAELAAGGGGRLLGGTGRGVLLADDDVEAGGLQPLGYAERGRVQRGHRWVPLWATRIFSMGVPHRGHGSPVRP